MTKIGFPKLQCDICLEDYFPNRLVWINAVDQSCNSVGDRFG